MFSHGQPRIRTITTDRDRIETYIFDKQALGQHKNTGCPKYLVVLGVIFEGLGVQMFQDALLAIFDLL